MHGGVAAFQGRQVNRVDGAFRVPFHLHDIGFWIRPRRTADEEHYLDALAQQVLRQGLAQQSCSTAQQKLSDHHG
jgi:hypothetical protein